MDFDSLPDDSSAPVTAPHVAQNNMAPTSSFDDLVDDTEKYSTPGQIAKTALEGAATGVLGATIPAIIETKMLGVDPADIRARKETNPITHGVTQAAGLVGTAVAGVGAGAVLGKAGALAATAAGLGETGAATSLGFRVGSAAVTQAAEMAVLQGEDEVAKMVLKDPDQSAETAISNIGLSAALGGAGGAFMTGAVNPLWKATIGNKVEKGLQTLSDHFNGKARILLPKELDGAIANLGIEIDPILKAPLAGEGLESFSKLKYAQNRETEAAIEKLYTDSSKSVMDSMGIPLEDAQVFSKNEAGHNLEAAFKDEYKAKYEPFEGKYEKMKAETGSIALPDEARLDRYGKLLERGMNEVGTDSPVYKLYDSWGERLLAKDTVAGVDQLRTEIGNDIEKAMRAADYNTANALKDIRSSFGDFTESQISKQGAELENLGAQGAKKMSAELLNERADLSRQYKEFATMSNELLDHVGAGRFKGAKTLINKIESVGAEGLLNKFSPKQNADIIPFLQKYFPDTLSHIQKSELLDLIKPAINSAKGEMPINVNKLSDIITKKLSGQKELVDFAISKETLNKIDSAKKLIDALPKQKDSGTPGGLTKLLADLPRSAMAGVAMVTGHNPIMGAVMGEMAQRLGKDAPEAVRLAHLKYLGSDQPIKAEGFKAMVDFFHNTYKGENLLGKATSNLFKSGSEVIGTHLMPSEKDRDKLDKQVSSLQKNPEDVTKLQAGDLGHYLPNHQTSLSKTATNALQYLQTLKPQPHIISPFDKPVPPQPVEIARYNRALNIAQQPAVVLQHIKDGTLMASDIADLHTMYPGIYKNMAQKISNEMIKLHSSEEAVPYRTRVSMALFLGTPVDKTMEPLSIMAAQPKPQAPPQQQQAPGSKHKGTNSLGKSVKNYMTPGQAAESDRASRD